MSEAMIGEIRFFPYGFTPYGWLLCNGVKLQIANYVNLYATIGATYGGDNRTYFCIPDLQGTATFGAGQGPGLATYVQGRKVGSETVALESPTQLPVHVHTISLQTLGYALEKTAFDAKPTAGVSYASRYWYNVTQPPPIPSYFAYNPAASETGTNPVNPRTMAPQVLTGGGGQAAPVPHENRQPYLALRPCICWDGYFMPRP